MMNWVKCWIPRLRGATGPVAVQSEQTDVDMGAGMVENHISSDSNNGDRIERAPMLVG